MPLKTDEAIIKEIYYYRDALAQWSRLFETEYRDRFCPHDWVTLAHLKSEEGDIWYSLEWYGKTIGLDLSQEGGDKIREMVNHYELISIECRHLEQQLSLKVGDLITVQIDGVWYKVQMCASYGGDGKWLSIMPFTGLL